jgi:UDP-N-acetylmuramate dehydrogenase
MTPQSDVSLASLCTMGVGGPARWFVEAHRETDVVDALHWAESRGAAVFILGGGSNVVIADEGFDGLVLNVDIRGIDRSDCAGDAHYAVGAGEPWDPFVELTVQANLAGLECLSGSPGCVGGTPIQNVGAYGQDVSRTLTRVHAIDRRTRQPIVFSRDECRFGYRTSRFKREDADTFVITRVEYALTPEGVPTVSYADVVKFFERRGTERPALREVREAILDIRRQKGMVVEPPNPARRSCGSFFVNPVVSRELYLHMQSSALEHVPHYDVDGTAVKIPAAWLIERAGFAKGTTRGTVGISPFQAQAIVNHGGASAKDVVRLAGDVKRAVQEKFGISLVPEPRFVGFRRDRLHHLLYSHDAAV